MMEKPKEIPKEKETQKCYICLDIPVDPIYPGGCTHALCKSHLKVHKKINLIVFRTYLECNVEFVEFLLN
jgi:hypothetical protein